MNVILKHNETPECCPNYPTHRHFSLLHPPKNTPPTADQGSALFEPKESSEAEHRIRGVRPASNRGVERRAAEGGERASLGGGRRSWNQRRRYIDSSSGPVSGGVVAGPFG